MLSLGQQRAVPTTTSFPREKRHPHVTARTTTATTSTLLCAVRLGVAVNGRNAHACVIRGLRKPDRGLTSLLNCQFGFQPHATSTQRAAHMT